MKMPLFFGLFLACLQLETLAVGSNQVHCLKFFIHPDLTTNLSMGDLRSRLVLYVEDINSIFSKQTIHSFAFNPDADVVITTNAPYSGSPPTPLPADHEIWAHVQPSQFPSYGTHGGFMASDSSGAVVAAGLHWDAVHDRSTLTSGAGYWDLIQYWRQIHHLTHEIEHTFGAGLPEYYNLRYAQDLTGEPPILSLSIDDPQDSYWSRHEDFLTDPLTLWTPDLSYSNLMAQVRFADMTAAIINARISPWDLEFESVICPDLSQTRIIVRDSGTGAIVPNTTVKVWKVRPFYPYECFLIVNTNSDANGTVEFAWGDPVGNLSNYNQLLLIKVYAPGGWSSVARWATTTEAIEAKMLRSQAVFEIPMSLACTLKLEIASSTSGVEMFWPASVTNVVLQSRDLVGNPPWSNIIVQPVINGSNCVVTVTPSGLGKLFRLMVTQ